LPGDHQSPPASPALSWLVPTRADRDLLVPKTERVLMGEKPATYREFRFTPEL